MKKNKSLVATMLVFVLLLLTSIGGMSVFAEEGEASADSDAVADETQVAVSGCDLKKENLIIAEVKQYGFSMLVPDGYLTTIESDSSVFEEISYSRSYFMEQGCIMQVFTSNDNYCAVSLFVDELSSIYDYYGDYSKLSKEQQTELINASLDDGNTSAEFVTINGRTYLESSITDSYDDEENSDVYTQYQFVTVIDGKQYELYIQAVNAVDTDLAVINEMINSIELKGAGIELSALDVTLIVVCVILVLAVALAYFFLFRANEFFKAGIKDYVPVGFDLPARADEDFDDDDDDFDDDEDFDEDDEDEDSEDDSDDDSDEKDVFDGDSDDDEDDDDSDDDERIIKD